MNDIDVSIVIPFYNDYEHVRASLFSIFNQDTKLKYEVIIVMNGIKSYKGNAYNQFLFHYGIIKNVTIVNHLKKDISTARNIGIEKAKGRYIMFLDSDDQYDLKLFKLLENDILSNKYDIIKYGANRIENNIVIGEIKSFNYKVDNGKDMLIKLIESDERVFSPVWLYCIRKNLFVYNNIYFSKNRYHEDYGIISKLLMKANDTKSYEFHGYNYFHRNGSVTRTNDYKVIRDKSFDFLYHSKELLRCAENNLDREQLELFKNYILDQTERKAKYLKEQDALEYVEKVLRLERI